MTPPIIRIDPGTSAVPRLLSDWQFEHRDLLRSIADFRRWVCGLRPSEDPLQANACDQLNQLRERLVQHFAREDEIGDELKAAEPSAAMELQAMCRQAGHEHAILLRRLDDLVARLMTVGCDCALRNDLINEIEMLVDAIDEHEEQEAECLAYWSWTGCACD